MKITRKTRFTDIDYKEEKKRYCQYCHKYKLDIKLTRRPNYNEIDKDMWWYCPNCHRTFLPRENPMEGRLKAAVDTKMYEEERTIIGMDNLLPKESDPKKKALKERIEKETDLDVIALLKQGYDVQEEAVNSGR